MRFTDKGLQALRRKRQRYEIVEDGGTGLAVRVSERGIKTFCYLYRFDRKPKRLTLGAYRDPAMERAGGSVSHDARGLPYLTLADARIRLAEARKKRDGGIDPAADAVTEHRAERKAQTVDELIDSYLVKYARLNTKAGVAAETERILKKEVSPAWGSRKATSIKRSEVIELLDGIVGRDAPIAANRTLAKIGHMFRWAVRQGIVPFSPAQDMDKPGGQGADRDRSLSDGEIAEFWRATETLSLTYRVLFRLLLVTGQRRGEVAGMRESEIELGDKLWTIPGGRDGRTKNRLAHEVPLSPLALELLGQLPPIDNKTNPLGLLFKARGVDRPVSGFKEEPAKLKRAILAARKEAAAAAGDEAEPMPQWVLHDLRRTVRTNLSKLRVDSEIAERVINHVPGGVRRTYDRHQYRREKAEALNLWARRLKQIISAAPATDGRVVRLRRAD